MMNCIVMTIACLLGIAAAIPYSRGVYRIPYESGTKVGVSRDASNHSPIGRIDMSGRDGSMYKIVAAAGGYVRYIEDRFTGRSTGACKNNYVWIEHPNGEWTKYSHIAQDSATARAGLSIGKWVEMGTYLGDEDDVGCTSGDHLHFEVAVPRDVDPIIVVGGFVNDNDGSHRNRIPRVCGIPGGMFRSGEEYVAEWQPENYWSGLVEIARHGLAIKYYQCQFDQMKDAGYEPVLLDVFNFLGRAYVNVVGRMRSSAGYGFHGYNSAAYQAVFTYFRKNGYQPVVVDSYYDSGAIRYAGYFKKASGPLYAGYHGKTPGQHQSTFNAWTKLGYFPTSLSVVSVNGNRWYRAVYVRKSQGSVLVKSTLPISSYQTVYNENLKAGRRVAYLNGYNHLGKAYIVAIFNSVTPSGGKDWHGLTSHGYQTEYDSARKSDMLTRVVTGYHLGGRRYAAAWRT